MGQVVARSGHCGSKGAQLILMAMSNNPDAEHRLFLLSPGLRPPFYEVVDHVYGHDSNVDTDGNSMTREAVDWTELYMAQRPELRPVVSVFPMNLDATVLCIESTSEPLARKTAEYLHHRCGGTLTERLPTDL
jgi:hypothetical protein